MSAFVLLLRGVNVGGHNRLPSASLHNVLSSLGAHDVATYIQSGNAVFRGDFDPLTLAGFITQEISTHHGFSPPAMIIPRDDFLAIRARFPFAAAEDALNTGHIWFTAGGHKPGAQAALDALATETETALVCERAVYLHAPEGIGRSKLATKVEKLLGVPATARNLKTTHQLCQMVTPLDP